VPDPNPLTFREKGAVRVAAEVLAGAQKQVEQMILN
jgi:hypothetical protein